MAFHWSAEAVERLAQLWGEGQTASIIANIIAPGELSRCAVIGKIDRLKLVGPRTRGAGAKRSTMPPPPRPPPPKPVSAPRRPLAKAIHMPVSPDALLPTSRPVKFMDLRSCHCRWPLGDPRTPEYRYCGAEKEPERSYCPSHAVMSVSSEYTYHYRRPTIVSREHAPRTSRILDVDAEAA